jgi:hypothetical protein
LISEDRYGKRTCRIPKIDRIDHLEHNAPSVRALKIFDIAQVTTTKALQFRHVVLGPE